VDSKSLLHSTKNTIQGGRQWPFSSLPPTPKIIIGSFTFYMKALEQLRGSGPHSISSYAAAWDFLYVLSKTFQELNFFQ